MHLNIPAKYETADGLHLGQWFRSMRRFYRLGELSEDKIRRLESIGMQWDSVAMRRWLEHYELAKQYLEEHGDSDIPCKFVCADGTKLGVWVNI